MELEAFELTFFEDFKLEPDGEIFNSDWGSGKFVVKDDRMHILFEEKGRHVDEQLMMVKIMK